MSEQQKRQKPAGNMPKTTSTPNPTASMQLTDVNAAIDSIDLIELFFKLLEKWKLIVCVTLIFTLLTGVYTFCFVTPMYEATSTIYVLNRSDSVVNLSDMQLGTALAKDYIKVFKMWEVHAQVIANMNLPYTYDEIQRMLKVTNDSDTRMLDITITSPDAAEAAAIANEYAKVASQFIADSMMTDKPSIMSVPLVPAKPVSPNKTRNLIVGFMLGAIAACGYVTVCFVLDDKYKTAEEIRKYTGLTTLAVVPVEPTDKDNKKSSGRH